MEKKSSTRLLPLLKKQFDEHQDSLTMVIVDWGKSKSSVYTWERRSSKWIVGRKTGSLR
jgi:hypothetical protein